MTFVAPVSSCFFTLHTACTDFASTGDPGWPAFDSEHRLTEVLGAPSAVSAYPEEKSRVLWQHREFPLPPLRWWDCA